LSKALDPFAVKSSKFPGGFLPGIYNTFGFETVAEVEFDPQYYSEAEIADLELLWLQSGWNKDDGYPSVSVIKWRGSDEQRATIREEWLKPDFRGFDRAGNSVNDRDSVGKIHGWASEVRSEVWSGQYNNTNDTRAVRDSNAARITNRL